MLDEASYKGARLALKSLSATKTKWTTQRQAFLIYKETPVRKLLSEGKVKIRQNGNRIEYWSDDLEQYLKPKTIISEI